MRIFFAVPRSAWVDLNLRRSLEDMGHELVRFEFPGWPDEAEHGWRRHGKPRTNERLLATFRANQMKKPVELVFGYFYSSVVYPETIDLIRRSGVPTVNFSCNNVHQFELVRDIAPHFDACIVPEAAAQQDFLAVGARPLRIQLAANPRVYRPYPEPRIYDVTFVGQRYADRADFLQHLRDGGVDARAWGAGWQPRKRLDVAHAKAALALLEDERLDGLDRLLRQRVDGLNGLLRQRVDGLDRLLRQRVDGVDRLLRQRPDRTDRLLRQRPDPPDRLLRQPLDGPGRLLRQPLGGPGSELSRQPATGNHLDSAAFGGPRLLHHDLVRLFSQSRISLGFATAGNTHLGAKRLTHLRLREFEAPMSGALYLTEDQPELAEYFEPGKEVLTYTDRDDLLGQVRRYLVHQEEAERIRRAGYERARREHTWQHRFTQLFDALGLDSR